MLAQEAFVTVATLVQLRYQAKSTETSAKTFEFSRRAMEEHWKAGYDDTRNALAQPRLYELPQASEAARAYDVRTGWET